MLQQKRQWLANIRANLKLTTYQTAEKCGISQSFYSSVENGIRSPSVSKAMKIAEALGFDWQRFYEGNEPENTATQAIG